MSLSLGKKMSLGGISLVLIPLLIVGVYAYYTASTAMMDSAKQSVFDNAKRISETLDYIMKGEAELLMEAAASPTTVRETGVLEHGQGEQRQNAATVLTAELDAVKASVGHDYETIFIADPSGKVIADGNNGAYKNIDISNRDYFQKAMTGEISKDNMVVSKKTGKPIAMIAVPIKGADDKVAAVLAAGLKTAFFNAFTSTKVGKTGYPVVTNNSGLTLAHPKGELVMKLDMSKVGGMEPLANKVVSGSDGVVEYHFKGVDKFAGVVHVPGINWSVLIALTADEFLEPVHNITKGHNHHQRRGCFGRSAGDHPVRPRCQPAHHHGHAGTRQRRRQRGCSRRPGQQRQPGTGRGIIATGGGDRGVQRFAGGTGLHGQAERWQRPTGQ